MTTATDPMARSADEAWYIRGDGVYRESRQTSVCEVLRLLGAEVDNDSRSWARSIALPLWRIPAGITFLHTHAVADAIYVVRFGYFKIVKVAQDGYPQVRGLAGPGDVLGFEGAALGRHPLDVAALDDCSVIALPLSELRTLRHESLPFDLAITRALGEQLTHAGDTASLMAAVAAEARLARFILWMSARMAAHGESPRCFVLRMSRRDIANLLAVAHETISRSFSQMADNGYIKVDGREVEILDLAALQACSLSTRRDRVEAARRSTLQQPAQASTCAERVMSQIRQVQQPR
ncbi:MAG: Crp/Fnr family transcriptional regulator [Burkholderiales bacterium]|nr:Crp/Fnr family transcriptional regulator [Burkholderiales bacterium]